MILEKKKDVRKTFISLVTVALTDLFWVRMGLLAAGLGVCALWAARHRDQVMRLVAVFRKKSA